MHPTSNIVAARTTFPIGPSWSTNQQVLALYSVHNTKELLLITTIPGNFTTAAWSPDGSYLAIGGASISMAYGGESGFFNTDNLRIYQFNGLSLLPIASYNYPPGSGAQVVSISWQPGQTAPYYLAVSYTGAAGTYFYKLQKLSFNASTRSISFIKGLFPSYVGSQDTGYVSWSATGSYLATTYFDSSASSLLAYNSTLTTSAAASVGTKPCTALAWNHVDDRVGVSTVNATADSNAQTRIYSWNGTSLASKLGIISSDATGWNGALSWSNNDNDLCLYAGKGCTAANGGVSGDPNPIKIYAYTKGSPDTITTVTSFSVNPSTDAVTAYPSLSGSTNAYVGQSAQGSVGWSAQDQFLFAGCYGTRATGPYSLGTNNNDLRCYAWAFTLPLPIPYTSVDYGTVNATDSTGSSATAAAWSPDGNYLAVGGVNAGAVGGFSSTNQVRIYKINEDFSLSAVTSFNYGTAINSVAWSDDSTHLAVAGTGPGNDGMANGINDSNDIRVYRYSNSVTTSTTSVSSGGTVNSLAWRTSSGGTKYLFTGCAGVSAGNIRVYSLSGSTLTSVVQQGYTSNPQIYSLAVTPWANGTGSYLAIGTDRQAQEFQTNQGQSACAVYLFNGSTLAFKASVQDVSETPGWVYVTHFGYNTWLWTPGGVDLSPAFQTSYFRFYLNTRKVCWSPNKINGNYILGTAGLWYSRGGVSAECTDNTVETGVHYTRYTNPSTTAILPTSSRTPVVSQLYNLYSFNASTPALVPFNQIESGTTWKNYYKTFARGIDYAMDLSSSGSSLLIHAVPSLSYTKIDSSDPGSSYALSASLPDVYAFELTGTGLRIGAPMFDFSYGATVKAIISRPGTTPQLFAVVGQNPANDVTMSGFENYDEIRIYGIPGCYPLAYAAQAFGNTIDTYDVTRPERGMSASIPSSYTISSGESVVGAVDLAGGLSPVSTLSPIPTIATTQSLHDGDLDLTQGCLQLDGSLKLGPGSNILTARSVAPYGSLYLNDQTLFLVGDTDLSTTVEDQQTAVQFSSPGTIDGLGNNLSIDGNVDLILDGATSLNKHTFKNMTFANLWDANIESFGAGIYDVSDEGIILDNVTILIQPGKTVRFATPSVTIRGNCTIEGGGTFALGVLSAWYGDPTDETKRIDVTTIIRGQLASGATYVIPTNSLFGQDPSPGIQKRLSVTWDNGVTSVCTEGYTMYLPDPYTSYATITTATSNLYVAYAGVLTKTCWNKNNPAYFAVTGDGSGCAKAYKLYGNDGGAVGALEHTLSFTTAFPYSCAWSPNGQYLAVGGAVVNYVTVNTQIFNGSTFAHVHDLASTNWVQALAWSADSLYLAVGYQSGAGWNIYAVNSGSFDQVGSVKSYGGTIGGIRWISTGGHSYVAVAGDVGLFIYSFDGSTITQTASKDWGEALMDVEWSADGKYVAVGGHEPNFVEGNILAADNVRIYSFNSSTGAITPVIGRHYGTTVRSLSWNPVDNQTIVAVGSGAANGGTNNPFTDTNLVRFYQFTGTTLNGLATATLDSPLRNVGTMNSCEWDPTGVCVSLVGSAVDREYYGILQTNIIGSTGVSQPAITIDSGAKLYVGQGTTLQVGTINFVDNSSQLYFDGGNLLNTKSTGPMHLTKGMLTYNGLVTMSSLHNSLFAIGDGASVDNDLRIVGQAAATLKFDQTTGCTGSSTMWYRNIH
ncbi:MAG: WD40 repeat domain-containing protein [Candidatus Babeliales bacterium]